ncbi:TPA: hypothetical protein NED87_004799 [Escherichia coli]|nr:hypothetical protein [Escherichia coli]
MMGKVFLNQKSGVNILIETNTVLFLWPNLLMEKPHNLPIASCSWSSGNLKQNKQGITGMLSHL